MLADNKKQITRCKDRKGRSAIKKPQTKRHSAAQQRRHSTAQRRRRAVQTIRRGGGDNDKVQAFLKFSGDRMYETAKSALENTSKRVKEFSSDFFGLNFSNIRCRLDKNGELIASSNNDITPVCYTIDNSSAHVHEKDLTITKIVQLFSQKPNSHLRLLAQTLETKNGLTTLQRLLIIKQLKEKIADELDETTLENLIGLLGWKFSDFAENVAGNEGTYKFDPWVLNILYKPISKKWRTNQYCNKHFCLKIAFIAVVKRMRLNSFHYYPKIDQFSSAIANALNAKQQKKPAPTRPAAAAPAHPPGPIVNVFNNNHNDKIVKDEPVPDRNGASDQLT